jgi:hypothetical protein
VKDDLEEHLYEMVCSRKLDLSTAQRDIATDWIAEHKKYFHTDKPLPLRSDSVEYIETVSVPPMPLGNSARHLPAAMSATPNSNLGFGPGAVPNMPFEFSLRRREDKRVGDSCGK